MALLITIVDSEPRSLDSSERLGSSISEPASGVRSPLVAPEASNSGLTGENSSKLVGSSSMTAPSSMTADPAGASALALSESPGTGTISGLASASLGPTSS